MNKRRKKGFTLIEMIAVIAILAITLMLTYTLFNKAYSTLNRQEQESIVLDEARNFSSILEEDMKLASDVKTSTLIPGNYGLGSSITVLVEITNTSSEKYIYTKETTKIVKYKVSGSTSTKMATLANYVVDVQLSPLGTKSYKVYIKSNRKDIETSFETVVTRRMI